MLDFQRKKQLGILIKLAMADNDFDEKEKAAIFKISDRYDASREEVEELFIGPPINDCLAPMTVTDKLDLMMDSILVVLADNVVTVSEDKLARQVALRLGFREDVVPFLIDHKDTEREEMRTLMLPYLCH